MTRTTAALLAPVALLGGLLAGCGSSSNSATPAGSSSGSPSVSSSAPSSSATSSSPAPGFASTSAGTPHGVLSKPDFLIDMNALCSAVDAQVQALPTPTGATDFAAISTNLSGILRIQPVYIAHAAVLVARTAQHAELEKNWLAVERADYAAFKPIAAQMIKDSTAHDPAKVSDDANALSAAPDHGSTLATYLTDFGLPSCAHLETE
jgi:hypothetical protein